MKPLIHLPIDFEQRDDVRTLARALRQSSAGEVSGDQSSWIAVVYAVRLWLDFARVGVDWRPLQQARSEQRDWAGENLTHLLEECCGWKGDAGRLLALFLEAGMLVVEPRGDLDGLVLCGFAAFNPHLLPGYQSIHARGGHAKAERARQAQTDQLAAQQVKVLEQQGLALFAESDGVSPDEQQKTVALIMGFDTAAGGSLRSAAEYVADKGLMRDALSVLRLHSWEDVVLVQRYIAGHRRDPLVVKETAAILRGFNDHLRKAKQ